MTVGFLGLGRIGRGTLVRLRPFGYQFVVHDPGLSEADAQTLGVQSCTRQELLARASVLVLHLPLSPATRHVVGREAIERLPRGAFVVNTARGGLIDEAALAQALASGHLAGAALDVFEQEPLPANSPLRSAPNLLLSPHAGWYSDGALGRLQQLVADEVGRALAGQPARCPVF